MEGWQLPLVLTIVALAVLYVAWRTWREWRGKKSCGGCACAKPGEPEKSAPTFVAADQLQVKKTG